MSRRSKDEERDEERLDTQVDVLRGRIKDSEDLKVWGSVFDTRTLMNLYSLASKGVIDALGGPVCTGKEANIFYALKDGKALAIKIYRISTSNFKAMQDYLAGDPRFGRIRGNKKGIVNAWTRKEYRNLMRAEEAGIRVPHPRYMVENILVMDLIGDEVNAAPQLKDVDLEPEEAARVLDKITEYISILYHKAGLIHADLSEFNVLYYGEPILIDMGQSVTLEHPMARKFLERDISNIVRYFRKKYGIGSEEEIWSRLRADKPAEEPIDKWEEEPSDAEEEDGREAGESEESGELEEPAGETLQETASEPGQESDQKGG